MDQVRSDNVDAQEYGVVYPLYLLPVNVKRGALPPPGSSEVDDGLAGVQDKIIVRAPSYQVLNLSVVGIVFLQGQVEDVWENSSQLMCTQLHNSTWHLIWSCHFDGVDPPQGGAHLVLLQDEGPGLLLQMLELSRLTAARCVKVCEETVEGVRQRSWPICWLLSL